MSEATSSPNADLQRSDERHEPWTSSKNIERDGKDDLIEMKAERHP